MRVQLFMVETIEPRSLINHGNNICGCKLDCLECSSVSVQLFPSRSRSWSGVVSFTDTEVHLNAKVPREKAKNNPKEFADLNRRSENVLTTNHQGFTLQNG